MKIGIDARLLSETGVGRYVRNLIRELSVIDKENEYIVFLRRNAFDVFQAPNGRWSKRLVDVPWHSITEQIVLPWLFFREHLDLLHVPYFNAPILYPGKYIITIHDLTILHFDTGKASTLPYWLYKIRRIGYRLVLSLGIKRASHILCVSHTVKNDVIAQFHKSSKEVSVTYEGVDPVFTQKKSLRKNTVSEKYLLYVGNVYPHKNIDTLLNAYEIYAKKSAHPQKLVFVGPNDYFYEKLKQQVASKFYAHRVLFFHGLSDEVIKVLYADASALLFPSLMEGFGLPAIEALTMRCPVICSDIPIFHEILGVHATYVNAKLPDDMARAIIYISSKAKSHQDIADLSLKFSLRKMAEETLAVYETT